jgi:hypothetical protein
MFLPSIPGIITIPIYFPGQMKQTDGPIQKSGIVPPVGSGAVAGISHQGIRAR